MIKLTEIQQEYLKTSMTILKVLIEKGETLSANLEENRELVKNHYRKSLDFVSRDMGREPFPEGTVVVQGEGEELLIDIRSSCGDEGKPVDSA
mgnify:CR=1 FL=1